MTTEAQFYRKTLITKLFYFFCQRNWLIVYVFSTQCKLVLWLLLVASVAVRELLVIGRDSRTLIYLKDGLLYVVVGMGHLGATIDANQHAHEWKYT